MASRKRRNQKGGLQGTASTPSLTPPSTPNYRRLTWVSIPIAAIIACRLIWPDSTPSICAAVAAILAIVFGISDFSEIRKSVFKMALLGVLFTATVGSFSSPRPSDTERLTRFANALPGQIERTVKQCNERFTAPDYLTGPSNIRVTRTGDFVVIEVTESFHDGGPSIVSVATSDRPLSEVLGIPRHTAKFWGFGQTATCAFYDGVSIAVGSTFSEPLQNRVRELADGHVSFWTTRGGQDDDVLLEHDVRRATGIAFRNCRVIWTANGEVTEVTQRRMMVAVHSPDLKDDAQSLSKKVAEILCSLEVGSQMALRGEDVDGVMAGAATWKLIRGDRVRDISFGPIREAKSADGALSIR